MKWFHRYAEYGFTENIDYRVIDRLVENPSVLGGRPSTDYEVTIEMAKELAMLQKTEKGKLARQYFIELEKRWNSPEMVMARAIKMADAKITMLEAKIQDLTPDADFGKTVGSNKGGILVRDYVKLLANGGINIGQNKFFKWLHANGYIYRTSGRKAEWVPYKKYVEMELFQLRETPISDPEYGDWISFTFRITGKGQKYFYEKLKPGA
jgi:anti-repressor protein